MDLFTTRQVQPTKSVTLTNKKHLMFSYISSSSKHRVRLHPSALCSTRLPLISTTSLRTITNHGRTDRVTCRIFADNSSLLHLLILLKTNIMQTVVCTSCQALRNTTTNSQPLSCSAPCHQADEVASTKTPQIAAPHTEAGLGHVITTIGIVTEVVQISATDAARHVTGTTANEIAITETTATTSLETDPMTGVTGSRKRSCVRSFLVV